MISVIIPVYNVENYLRQCIDSVLEQTLTNFEIILVDDGSTDASGEICEEYLLRDKRIQTLHQTNQGLSAARNHGLDMAKGEYVTFIDSDDIVSRHYLRSLFNGITSTSAQISMCAYQRFEGEKPEEGNLNNQYIVSGWREKCISLKDDAKYCVACAKLYRASLFQKIRFTDSCRCHEDEDIIYKLYYAANTIAETNAELYYYRITPNSIMNKPFTLQRWTILDILEKRQEFFRNIGDEELAHLTDIMRATAKAKLFLQARRFEIFRELPAEYKMSKRQALHVIHQNCPENNYQWYLSQVYPALLRPYIYLRKIKEKLGILRTG